MNQKIGQQSDVQEKIHRHNTLSEEKRRRLRCEYSLMALSQGSLQVLGSDEFVTDLTGLIGDGSEEKEKIAQVLNVLCKAADSPDKTIRERTLAILACAAIHAFKEQDAVRIVLLVNGFHAWLAYEQDFLPGLETIIKRIEELSGWLFQRLFLKETVEILKLMARIEGGELKKSAVIRSLVGKALRTLATEQVVEKLADNYLRHDNDQELCREILGSLGRQSMRLLLQRFSRGANREERQELLCLVSSIGGDALPVLVEDFLQQQHSPEAVRDLISFVAEQREEAIYPALHRCFGHENKRVQHEMIRCVVKLGGDNMRDRLLAGLGVVHENLKISVIRLLVEHAGGDESVLSALLDLIERRHTYSPGERQGLLGAITVALQAFPFRRSTDMLCRLQREYTNIPGSDRLLLQIDRSLKTLGPQLRHSRQHHNGEHDVFFDSDPAQHQASNNKIAKIEEEVKKILRQGDSKAAGQFLYQKARAAGKERDFLTAQKLQERILQVDPMALAEVLELGQWLEEQKKCAVEPLLSEIWYKLRDLLAAEEFRALHQALRRENYRRGETIVEAGELDESLYFLTSGHIGLNCFSGGDERFLKKVKPGDVLGSSQFFTASVWTSSLRALSEVQVQLLDREAFRLLAAKFPDLEQKLHQYCAQFERMIAQFLKTSGEDRRQFPRYQATWPVTSCLLDPYDEKESRNFTGRLVDISRNGLSFTVKISSRDHARLLLGRELASEIQGGRESIARCNGIVVGVRLQDAASKNFNIHVQLASKMDDGTFHRIVTCLGKKCAAP